jgi:hypothetical protein
VAKIYGGSTTGRNDEITKVCDRQMQRNRRGSFDKLKRDGENNYVGKELQNTVYQLKYNFVCFWMCLNFCSKKIKVFWYV